MDLGINGKIALVTAASRGLGRGCAEQLAAEKCRVAICSREPTKHRESISWSRILRPGRISLRKKSSGR